jgi:AcrR family transcriptional regulator
MRLKTDDRRRAILEAACDVFRDMGFERASMAAISARAGGSKTTLYSYFASKEELFIAAMLDAMEEQGQQALDLLDALDPDIAGVLERFGRAFLEFLTGPEKLAVIRTAITEGGKNSALGPELYGLGPQRCWNDVAAYIATLQARGALRAGDPQIIAAHLKGLLEAGIIEPLLFGAEAAFNVKDSTPAAVAAFLRMYGVG